MRSTLRFSLPAKREFVGLVRLAVGGLSQVTPFEEEVLEDIKLVMSELCNTIVLGGAGESETISFSVHVGESEVCIELDSSEAVDALVSQTSAGWRKKRPEGFGLSIITALMDNVELLPSNGRSILRLKKLF